MIDVLVDMFIGAVGVIIVFAFWCAWEFFDPAVRDRHCCKRSLWCVLDHALVCESRFVCDRHDAAIRGQDDLRQH